MVHFQFFFQNPLSKHLAISWDKNILYILKVEVLEGLGTHTLNPKKSRKTKVPKLFGIPCCTLFGRDQASSDAIPRKILLRIHITHTLISFSSFQFPKFEGAIPMSRIANWWHCSLVLFRSTLSQRLLPAPQSRLRQLFPKTWQQPSKQALSSIVSQLT